MNPRAADLLKALDENIAAQGKIIAELRAMLEPEPVRRPEPEIWLSTGQIAQRIGVSKGRVADLCRTAKAQGVPGVRKAGPRLWQATSQAINTLNALRGAR